MARGVEYRRGGILDLLTLYDEHQEAITYELLNARYRLEDIGTGVFTWYDFYVLVRRWQKLPGNALAASLNNQVEIPSFLEQIVAIMVDQLAIANWQRTRKRASKPKRLQRWWEKRKSQRLGRDPIPISQFDDWWESKARKGANRVRRSRARHRVASSRADARGHH